MSQKQTVLVTGAAGFLGSHLCDAMLAAGYAVRAVDNLSGGSLDNLANAQSHPDFVFRQADLKDSAACRQLCAGADYVLHQAALASVPTSIADPLRCHHETLDTTVNVLEAALRQGCQRFIYASSASIYGDTTAAPVAESLPYNPMSPYAAAKAGSEHYVQAFARMGLDGVSLRYFNVYGARQRADSSYSGVISIFAARARGGLPVTVYGDGLQSRDFIHVRDVCAANLAAMLHRKPLSGTAINVGTGRSVTLLTLVEGIGHAMGRAVQVKHEPARQGDIRHSCADVARARKVLGFSAAVGLEEGLRSFLGAGEGA